jgi:hypothetical protein
MVQLARSVKHRVAAAAWFAAAACSPPDWPDVSPGDGASASGGSGSNPGASASGGLNGDAPPTNVVTRDPRPASGSGKDGPLPVDGGAPTPDASGTAGASGESLASEPDAGVEAVEPPPDASTEPPAPADPEPVCDGTLLDGVCWYLGAAGESCNGVCATHGAFSPVSAAVLGTPAQGGSVDGCAAVLGALIGFSDTVREGYRDDGRGLGCHVYEDDEAPTIAWWLASPELSPEVSLEAVRVVCGCSR